MKNKLFLSALCAAACAGTCSPVSTAHAQEIGSVVYYDIDRQELNDHYVEWKNFLEYQLNREPCQNYVMPPEGYYMKGCKIYRYQAPVAAAETSVTRTETTTTTVQAPSKLLPIVSSYTIYFDFDKANIRESENETLGRVVQEIATYNPSQVTVAGYTDTSGSQKYNDALSQRRAQSVAKALTAYGINNQVIDKKAFGEAFLAVQTKDDVKMEENRRVVIDFRR